MRELSKKKKYYMELTDKVKIAKEAIKEVMEGNQVYEHEATAKQLLFQLLSQLGSLQEEDRPEVDKTEEKPDPLQEEELCPEVDKKEEIMKEVKNVKNQNLVTQCLVSAMTVLTVAWQISEVCLVLKVRNGLRNPLSFFGGMILKTASLEGDIQQSSAIAKQKPPVLKIPGLPLLDLFPIFDSSDEEFGHFFWR